MHTGVVTQSRGRSDLGPRSRTVFLVSVIQTKIMKFSFVLSMTVIEYSNIMLVFGIRIMFVVF